MVENVARVGRKFELDQFQPNSIQLKPSGWPNDTQLHRSCEFGLSWEDRLARALDPRQMTYFTRDELNYCKFKIDCRVKHRTCPVEKRAQVNCEISTKITMVVQH